MAGVRHVRRISAYLIVESAANAMASTKPPPNRLFSLDDLARIIAERASASVDKSYTRSLLEKGPAGAAKKFGEEAIEFVIAASAQDNPSLRAEAADVLYHLLVVLEARGVKLTEVLAELERRTAQSGHQEKAARAK
jgi:phosphoribosyl-ATP pyrophosphohydrolase